MTNVGTQFYSVYKDTGVSWLGSIPGHWKQTIGFAVISQKNISNTGMVETTVLSLSRGRIVIKPPEKLHGLVPESFETYQIVEPGDIIVRPTDLQNDQNTIRVGIARNRGIITSAYLCFGTREPMLDEYAYLLLLGYDLKKVFYGLGSGLRQNLDWSDFKRLPMPLPPLEEQNAMVAFIRQFDVEVASFVRNRRRLIEVLNEQKDGIINRVVSCGLDHSCSRRSSGLDWLGFIPEHWRSVRLKNVAHVQTGITLGKNYAGRQNLEERPYLRVANVQTGRLDLNLVKTITLPASDAYRYELRSGDVLMTEGGDIDKLGRGCVWRGEIEGCLHQNHIFAVRANQSKLLPEYLVALMASKQGRMYFTLSAKQTTNLASTNSSTLRAFPLFLPDIAEQRQIVSVIASETRGLDAACSQALQEIELVREYRVGLIADVVTGKIDVRGFAPVHVDDVTYATLKELEELGGVDEIMDGEESELFEEATGADN